MPHTVALSVARSEKGTDLEGRPGAYDARFPKPRPTVRTRLRCRAGSPPYPCSASEQTQNNSAWLSGSAGTGWSSKILNVQGAGVANSGACGDGAFAEGCSAAWPRRTGFESTPPWVCIRLPHPEREDQERVRGLFKV